MIKRILFIAIIAGCAWLYFRSKDTSRVTEINWQMLDIGFKKTWDAPYNRNVDMPVFPDTLTKLNGHSVSISGFVIPMEYGSKKFALSKNPSNSCFFCGQGGVETIVIVNCKNKPVDYPNDAYIKMTGKFVLTHSFNDFIYTLSDAY
jgi:hypothetical protein